MCILVPLLKKNCQSRSRVMRMCQFRAQNGPFVPNKIFLVQTIIVTFIYLLALFIVQNLAQNGPLATKKILFEKLSVSFSCTYQPLSMCKIFKKILPADPEDTQFLGPKWPIFPNQNFFRKPVNEPCFFHSCLSTCQKIKVRY